MGDRCWWFVLILKAAFSVLAFTNRQHPSPNTYHLIRAPETVNVPLAVSIIRRPFSKYLRAF